MANKWGADYLLSVHINAGGGTGYEDFIHNNLSNTSNTAKLRDVIHAEIIKEIGGTNRGKKKANFHMLRESKMSAMLTENLFIDKKADADKLKDATFINKIVKGHAEGLAKAFNLKKISSNNPPTPTDDKRWRIQTGLFDNANSYSNALKRMADKFPWLLHENATTTELNPRYRIVTGLFTGKNVAEYHAEQLKKEFGWNVSVVKR